ncbi:hypothetical protein EN868_11195 [Mesorhizobium sp. M2D.F.Ca.ET.225.01.1.1]|uniref:hypothetical protein n=1 Tax=unclassified Mesorhizobium TaxID=325217 RepID=UPI000FD49A31|nr:MULTISPECIES: hypothetical protein [unclassified Mesorhizobium]TGP59550.1 hypothetical protein EN869_014865 [Mesorhizobium sp. M2D.F.Ca.ET.226.01.1.1]TGP69185.1 hypothetical protein EN868_11195 [Mesorhizobium sp. M2D.F.Ca.ET.225.01.1.1]
MGQVISFAAASARLRPHQTTTAPQHQLRPLEQPQPRPNVAAASLEDQVTEAGMLLIERLRGGPVAVDALRRSVDATGASREAAAIAAGAVGVTRRNGFAELPRHWQQHFARSTDDRTNKFYLRFIGLE